MAREMTNSWSWKPFETSNNETNLDIELLKSEVGKHFPFYDMRYNTNTAAFFCRIDKELLEENFEELSRVQTQEHGKTIDESRGETRRGTKFLSLKCSDQAIEGKLRLNINGTARFVIMLHFCHLR